MENRDHWGVVRETLGVIAVVIVIALITGFFLYAPMRTQAFWIGEKGWLEVVAPIGTLMAASVAASLAYMTYRANRLEGIDARFQKAIELMSNDQEVTRSGGVLILRDIIAADPGRYYLTGIDLLCVFVSERCAPTIAAYDHGKTVEEHLQAEYVPPNTPADVQAALLVIGASRTADRVAAFEGARNGRHSFAIDGVLLNEVVVNDLNFSRINLPRIVFGRALLQGCNFDGATMGLLPTTTSNVGNDIALSMQDCSFVKSFITRGLNDYSYGTKLSFSECDLTDAAVYISHMELWVVSSLVESSNMPFTDPRLLGCWYFHVPPEVKQLHEESMTPFATAFGRPQRRTKRGMQIFVAN